MFSTYVNTVRVRVGNTINDFNVERNDDMKPFVKPGKIWIR